MGVKHFCMGWDVGILFDWFKGNGAKLRAMMGDRRRHKGQSHAAPILSSRHDRGGIPGLQSEWRPGAAAHGIGRRLAPISSPPRVH